MSWYLKRRLLAMGIDAVVFGLLALVTRDWKFVFGAAAYGLWCFYDGFTRATT
jgi:hypothetical protein